MEEYISAITQPLPASEERLRQISTMQDQDEVCHQVKLYAKTDWPSPANLKGEIKLYWSLRDHLTVQNELLLRDARIVIPPPLRKETLDAIHSGHQGITKCRERGRHSVWWPGLSSQIDEIVSKCPVCAKEKHNRAEPLLCTQFPSYPWQTVATDLFELHGRCYLLVIDYYSRFIELSLLTETTSTAVINSLKSIFARYGLPERE